MGSKDTGGHACYGQGNAEPCNQTCTNGNTGSAGDFTIFPYWVLPISSSFDNNDGPNMTIML